jgi:hypothetical protein
MSIGPSALFEDVLLRTCVDKNWGRKNGPTRPGTLGQANGET